MAMSGGDAELRVLLISASFGEGHNQAAAAVREALEGAGAEARVVDYMDLVHPAIRSVAKFGLIQGVKRAPGLYGWFYRSTSRLDPPPSLQRRLNRLGIAQVRRWLRAYRPDAVLSTFPVPSGVISELRQAGETNVPSLVLVTDYTAHRQWFQPETDWYFVGTDAVKQELVGFGADEARIEVTGVPVRARFVQIRGEAADKRLVWRREHGLDPFLPMVLIMGGGAGVIAEVPAWARMIKEIPAQFVVICGHNERLQRRLAPLVSPRVQVLGYVEDVEVWMAMADLIVSKAGAITVTEALAVGTPMLLFRPIPGQEVKNAEFALSAGAAVVFEDAAEARAYLQHALAHPEVLAQMRANALRLRVNEAAGRIAERTLRFARQFQASRFVRTTAGTDGK
jgi:processive 1,2-diacylglycerol beta-glucosyltransferase